MSRGRKIGALIGGSVVGLLVLAIVTGIVIVQTDWFRNTVRTKIVGAVEEATGGTVEIRRFSFDWKHLRAVVDEFVIHGLEPTGAPPLLRVKRLQVDLKLLSPFKGMVDIAYLGVDAPQANVIVFPDGRTNIPEPKLKKPSDKNGLETIVDLAIRKFDLTNGAMTFANRKADLNASGENLRAQFAYNLANPSYKGELDIAPLRIRDLNVDVKLPLTLEKDKVALTDAHLTTPQSVVVISGAMEHLTDPRTSAHINARLAIDEVKRAAGLTMPLDTARGPAILTADITAAMDADSIRLTSARMDLGRSNIEASGTLQDPKHPAAVQFNSTLALNEIGRLLRVAARPEGTVKVGGNATLRANNDYLITANVDARNVAVTQGTTRLSGIALDSSVTADPRRIELGGLRLAALGGSFGGSAEIQNLDQFRVSGTLRNFDIQQVMRAFAMAPLGYGGVVSGPVEAKGSIQRPAALIAHTNLSIAPGRSGVPVTGRINADYNGAADTVTLAPSYIALPNTRADLAGALGQQIRVHVVSRNLSDLHPLAPSMPVALQAGGAVTIDANVTGKLTAPQIAGQVAMTNFTVEGRPFTRVAASVNASGSGASVTNGVLERGALRADFNATAGLRNWKPESFEPLRADITMRNADLADVLALAGQSSVAATGALTADAHINGTIGDPQGNADLTVVSGTIQGQRFDRLATRVVMTPGTITVPSLELVAGPSRIDANATYQHPATDLARGTLRAHVASNQVQIAQFRPDLRGLLTLNADATATVGTSVELTAVNGSASVRGIQAGGKNLGDFTATATTAGNAVQYNVNSNFGGSTIRVNGNSLLAGDHRTTANVAIANLPIESVLAVAGQPDPSVRGTLNATADVSGTLQEPRGTANVNLSVGTPGKQKLEQATITAETRGKDLSFNIKSGIGGSRIDGAGTVGLAGDYPLNAHLSFANLTLSGLRDWVSSAPQGVEASADGEVQVAGPAARTEELRGAFRLTKLEAHSVAAGPAGAKPRATFELHNEGPIVVALDRSLVTVQSARLTGTGTTLALTGTASLRGQPALNLRADGDIKLEVLEAFSPDIFSSGAVSLHAAVTGTPSQPVINGRLQLQNASFHHTDLPNGLTNGSGTIVFTGTEAVLQNVTGETGGGKLTLAGYVTYGGPEMQFRVQANTDQIRVEYPATVSTQSSARLTWAGTTSRSLLSGTVTIEDVALHSHSDVGTMLTSAAAPVASPTMSTGIMAGLRFDVKIQTAPGVQFRTTLTQNLQADANVTLRGTLDHPGMLGRVVVTQGQVVFFGHKYGIDQGTVAFYDPQKINPILNVNLETSAQGVDISISVTGPMDRLKFAYQSDPPMQFSDLVSLLASGKPPTSDPVIAAHAPVPPEQNLQQRGASTLLGQTVGNPVSGRLQRLFGVSALKIDPQIIGSNTPQATLTLQQQITKDLTFTYIQDVTQSNPQIIRVEWAIDPQWSAIAQRDLNGMFDLDFFYKRRFR